MSREMQFTVTLSNSFLATSHEDAVEQMVAWVDDNAYMAGYRSELDDAPPTPGFPESMFIDAERLFQP